MPQIDANGEIDEMELSDMGEMDLDANIGSLSDHSSSDIYLSSEDNSSDTDMSEHNETTCKCKEFVRRESVSDYVHSQCMAHDLKYGVVCACVQRATELLVYNTTEKFYCQQHAEMFRDHRQCPRCDGFCTQGDFLTCSAGDEFHWMNIKCINSIEPGCAHCQSTEPMKEESTFLTEESAFFKKMASVMFICNTGKQLNLLTLCDKDSDQWLLNLLDKALMQPTDKPMDTDQLCDMITRMNHLALLNKLFDQFAGDDLDVEYCEAVNESLRMNDNLSLLLVLQFMYEDPSFENVKLAVDRGNARAVNFLFHHGAPLKTDDAINGNENLLNRSLAQHKWIVAEEILKLINKDEHHSGRPTYTLVRDAIAASDVERLEFVLKHGANICGTDEKQGTMFHMLARMQGETATKMIQMICSNEHVTPCLLDKMNGHGETAVGIAHSNECWDMMRVLLEHGASPEGLPSEMKTPPSLNAIVERFRADFQLKRLFADPRNFLTRDLTMGRERHPITVENCVGDGALLDPDFEYSSTVQDLNVFRCKIDFSLACRCVNNCESDCPCVSRSCYDASGRLNTKALDHARRDDLGMILECNASCFCSSTCQSRVAQHGVRAHLEVYRSTRYGWAVRSSAPIQKGEFICEYTGELISAEEADQRENDTYLFEIVEDATSYCIDAKHTGNVSRFVNHSCDSNLFVVKVVWDANIRHFPHICFFAKNYISKGEELTIDYGKQWWDVKLPKFACQCGSKKCKYGEDVRAKLLESSAQSSDKE